MRCTTDATSSGDYSGEGSFAMQIDDLRIQEWRGILGEPYHPLPVKNLIVKHSRIDTIVDPVCSVLPFDIIWENTLLTSLLSRCRAWLP